MSIEKGSSNHTKFEQFLDACDPHDVPILYLEAFKESEAGKITLEAAHLKKDQEEDVDVMWRVLRKCIMADEITK
jgi:hypothetical protein